MLKYTEEFKLQVVKYCIEEHHGYKDAAKYFNMKESHTVLKWVRKYQEHGEKGLIKNNQKYDGKFKQNVVEYMHKNHLSLTETYIKFNLGNNQIVAKWEQIYSKEGPQALYEERRGRMKKMNFKPRKKKLTTESAEDLIAEVERLRMENAYLKKLQALVQERTKPKHSRK